MNQKAAICDALLKGKVLNIKNGFHLFGVTNVPREIGRSVERAFGVTIERKPEEGLSRYGQPCSWMNYFLDKKKPENKEGIEKMKIYVNEQKGFTVQPKKLVPSVDETEKWFNEYLEGKYDEPQTKLFIQKEIFE